MSLPDSPTPCTLAPISARGRSCVVTPTVIADDGEIQVVTVSYPLLLGSGLEARFFQIEVSTN